MLRLHLPRGPPPSLQYHSSQLLGTGGDFPSNMLPALPESPRDTSLVHVLSAAEAPVAHRYKGSFLDPLDGYSLTELE